MSLDLKASITVAAPPGRVFDALVRPEDLRAWFCEHAAIDPASNRYDFWGRSTPGAPGEADGRHPLLAFDPPRGLSYAWTLRGGASRVTFSVTPAGAGSVVELHHALPRGRLRREGALADFWSGALERLKAWIERGVAGFQTDFTRTPSADLRLSTEIAAPRAEVFRALVEPASLERWIAAPGKAAVEPRAGGSYDIGWGEAGGPVKILEIRPGTSLSYSWRYKNEPDTVVTWTLEGSGGTTRLTIVHSGFADAALHEPYLMGWGFFLNRIRLLAEAGQGRSAKVTGDDYEETAEGAD
ncbi:MAG TPA: SRPBCC domain-containing protein [Candidatus Eisenbacteria bacterium]|nr:SRPBCC domain-containing protein [Candidatus Eisenbacteria bacterium]